MRILPEVHGSSEDVHGGIPLMPRIAIARLRLAAVFVLLMPALVACSGSRKPEATVATDERSGVQSRLDAMMRVASPCTGAVLVSNAGKIIYMGLVGPPDATSRAGVTTESRFLIGSLTKQFTAFWSCSRSSGAS
jgi:CubicO group peptidase (beta-lactamase class C family)